MLHGIYRQCIAFTTRVVAAAGAHTSVCRLLALCLLHHEAGVRRAAVKGCRALLTDQPVLMAALLSGLRHWANHTAEALVLVVSDLSSF